MYTCWIAAYMWIVSNT